MIERGIHNKLNSPSAIQLYRLGLSKNFKSHKPALDHKPGSGVGAAYRAHDSNSPNEVSFIASSEWVGLGKNRPITNCGWVSALASLQGPQ
jgi:hypothetical protein